MKRAVNEGGVRVYGWPYVEAGGVQRYFIALMQRAAAVSSLVVVLPEASDAALVAELRAVGAECRFVRARLPVTTPNSLPARARQHLRTWHAEWAVWRACRRLAAPDTVFHLDVSPLLFTLPLAGLAASHVVVVTVHTPLPRVAPLRRQAWRARLAWLSRCPGLQIVASNRRVRDSLLPYCPSGIVEAIPIAYSPVDQNDIADGLTHGPPRREARALIGVEDDRFLVVTGGRFIDRKGCWVLAETARLVREADPGVDCVWVGPEPLSRDTAARIEAAGSGLRYVPHSAFGGGRRSYLGVIASADLFVLPSLEEGLPLALLEAMALGVAVVTTSVDAIPEAISDGDTGLLVPPNDPRRLADAILRLRSDAELRRALAASACRRVKAFDADETARITFEAYRTARTRLEASRR